MVKHKPKNRTLRFQKWDRKTILISLVFLVLITFISSSFFSGSEGESVTGFATKISAKKFKELKNEAIAARQEAERTRYPNDITRAIVVYEELVESGRANSDQLQNYKNRIAELSRLRTSSPGAMRVRADDEREYRSEAGPGSGGGVRVGVSGDPEGAGGDTAPVDPALLQRAQQRLDTAKVEVEQWDKEGISPITLSKSGSTGFDQYYAEKDPFLKARQDILERYRAAREQKAITPELEEERKRITELNQARERYAKDKVAGRLTPSVQEQYNNLRELYPFDEAKLEADFNAAAKALEKQKRVENLIDRLNKGETAEKMYQQSVATYRAAQTAEGEQQGLLLAQAAREMKLAEGYYNEEENPDKAKQLQGELDNLVQLVIPKPTTSPVDSNRYTDSKQKQSAETLNTAIGQYEQKQDALLKAEQTENSCWFFCDAEEKALAQAQTEATRTANELRFKQLQFRLETAPPAVAQKPPEPPKPETGGSLTIKVVDLRGRARSATDPQEKKQLLEEAASLAEESAKLFEAEDNQLQAGNVRRLGEESRKQLAVLAAAPPSAPVAGAEPAPPASSRAELYGTAKKLFVDALTMPSGAKGVLVKAQEAEVAYNHVIAQLEEEQRANPENADLADELSVAKGERERIRFEIQKQARVEAEPAPPKDAILAVNPVQALQSCREFNPGNPCELTTIGGMKYAVPKPPSQEEIRRQAAQERAQQIADLASGWTTSEEEGQIAALVYDTNSDPAELALLKEQFKAQTGQDLDAVLEDELPSDLLAAIRPFVEPAGKAPAPVPIIEPEPRDALQITKPDGGGTFDLDCIKNPAQCQKLRGIGERLAAAGEGDRLTVGEELRVAQLEAYNLVQPEAGREAPQPPPAPSPPAPPGPAPEPAPPAPQLDRLARADQALQQAQDAYNNCDGFLFTDWGCGDQEDTLNTAQAEKATALRIRAQQLQVRGELAENAEVLQEARELYIESSRLYRESGQEDDAAVAERLLEKASAERMNILTGGEAVAGAQEAPVAPSVASPSAPSRSAVATLDSPTQITIEGKPYTTLTSELNDGTELMTLYDDQGNRIGYQQPDGTFVRGAPEGGWPGLIAESKVSTVKKSGATGTFASASGAPLQPVPPQQEPEPPLPVAANTQEADQLMRQAVMAKNVATQAGAVGNVRDQLIDTETALTFAVEASEVYTQQGKEVPAGVQEFLKNTREQFDSLRTQNPEISGMILAERDGTIARIQVDEAETAVNQADEVLRTAQQNREGCTSFLRIWGCEEEDARLEQAQRTHEEAQRGLTVAQNAVVDSDRNFEEKRLAEKIVIARAEALVAERESTPFPDAEPAPAGAEARRPTAGQADRGVGEAPAPSRMSAEAFNALRERTKDARETALTSSSVEDYGAAIDSYQQLIDSGVASKAQKKNYKAKIKDLETRKGRAEKKAEKGRKAEEARADAEERRRAEEEAPAEVEPIPSPEDPWIRYNSLVNQAIEGDDPVKYTQALAELERIEAEAKKRGDEMTLSLIPDFKSGVITAKEELEKQRTDASSPPSAPPSDAEPPAEEEEEDEEASASGRPPAPPGRPAPPGSGAEPEEPTVFSGPDFPQGKVYESSGAYFVEDSEGDLYKINNQGEAELIPGETLSDYVSNPQQVGTYTDDDGWQPTEEYEGSMPGTRLAPGGRLAAPSEEELAKETKSADEALAEAAKAGKEKKAKPKKAPKAKAEKSPEEIARCEAYRAATGEVAPGCGASAEETAGSAGETGSTNSFCTKVEKIAEKKICTGKDGNFYEMSPEGDVLVSNRAGLRVDTTYKNAQGQSCQPGSPGCTQQHVITDANGFVVGFVDQAGRPIIDPNQLKGKNLQSIYQQNNKIVGVTKGGTGTEGWEICRVGGLSIQIGACLGQEQRCEFNADGSCTLYDDDEAIGTLTRPGDQPPQLQTNQVCGGGRGKTVIYLDNNNNQIGDACVDAGGRRLSGDELAGSCVKDGSTQTCADGRTIETEDGLTTTTLPDGSQQICQADDVNNCFTTAYMNGENRPCEMNPLPPQVRDPTCRRKFVDNNGKTVPEFRDEACAGKIGGALDLCENMFDAARDNPLAVDIFTSAAEAQGLTALVCGIDQDSDVCNNAWIHTMNEFFQNHPLGQFISGNWEESICSTPLGLEVGTLGGGLSTVPDEQLVDCHGIPCVWVTANKQETKRVADEAQGQIVTTLLYRINYEVGPGKICDVDPFIEDEDDSDATTQRKKNDHFRNEYLEFEVVLKNSQTSQKLDIDLDGAPDVQKLRCDQGPDRAIGGTTLIRYYTQNFNEICINLLGNNYNNLVSEKQICNKITATLPVIAASDYATEEAGAGPAGGAQDPQGLGERRVSQKNPEEE